MSAYSFSEFSKLTNLSRKALLIYEELGLLVPKTRSEKNYRKYCISQKKIADEISILKGLGFSLEDIKRIFVLKGGKTKSIKSMLLIQKERIINKIKRDKEQLNNLNELIKGKYSVLSPSEQKSIILNILSEKILSLNEEDLIECTKQIPAEDYIMTVAMVDETARNKMFSILSDRARELVKNDLNVFFKKYGKHWS